MENKAHFGVKSWISNMKAVSSHRIRNSSQVKKRITNVKTAFEAETPQAKGE